MGTLRKMGAFLGLVPDESERYDARGADGYAADDHHDGDHYNDGHYNDGHYNDGHYNGDHRNGDHHDGDHHDGDYRDQHNGGGDQHGYAPEAYAHDDYAAQSYGADRSGSEQYASAEYAAAGYPADGHAAAGDSAEQSYDRRSSELEYAGRYADDEQAGYETPVHGATPYQLSTRDDPAPQARRDTSRSLSGKRGRRGAGDIDYSTQGALAVQPQPSIDVVPSVDLTSAKPATVSLTGFADAREVGELYRTGQAVILDMTELTDAEARRMVDFSAGLAFAVRGSIDKVTTKVFMLHQPTGDAEASGR